MSPVVMTLRQFRFENKAFWRNPAAAGFTFAFPLMFLFIFNGLEVGPSQFYVPSIATFSVITACYTNIAMNISFSRDEGVLKRLRGTPLPSWIFLVAKVIHSTFLAIILVAIVAAAGTLLFDVDLPTDTMGAFIVSVLVGAAAFSALGLAIEIKPGTQSGEIVHLKGRGMPRLTRGGRGELMVVLKVETPTDLTPEQEELLARFAELRNEEIGDRNLFQKIKEAFS